MSSAPAASPTHPRQAVEPVITRPHRMAALLALIYGVTAILYILFSSQLAASVADTMVELKEIEQLKGVMFVIVTTVLLFLLALGFLSRLAAREAELRVQREIALAAEKRAAAGLFAASVAHDINNVLMVSGLAVDKLATAPDLSPDQRSLVSMLQQTNTRLHDLARRLGQASGATISAVREAIDLSALVHETVNMARGHQKVKHCSIDTRIAAGVWLKGDASLIHRMILNLVLNAADAGGNRGRIVIHLEERAESVVLDVLDDGPGVPEAEQDKIFQPLYTTKTDGSGLGLLSVQMCARAHGGDVALLPSEFGGACFRVTLAALPR